MKKLVDTQGTDTELTLPTCGTIPLDRPIANVPFTILVQELRLFYGDRYQIQDIER